MIAQARAELPNECCGLLAGRMDGSIARIECRFPLVNELISPTEYLSEPRSMFEAMRAIDRAGLDIVAVYHSHPTSPPIPSKTDRERNYSPDVANFIISLINDPPRVQAWWLDAERHWEADWLLVD